MRSLNYESNVNDKNLFSYLITWKNRIAFPNIINGIVVSFEEFHIQNYRYLSFGWRDCGISEGGIVSDWYPTAFSDQLFYHSSKWDFGLLARQTANILTQFLLVSF